jgi:hypothetical protein
VITNRSVVLAKRTAPIALAVVAVVATAALTAAGFTVWPLLGALVPPLVIVTLAWWFEKSAFQVLASLLAVPLAVARAAVPLLLTVLVVAFYSTRALAPVLQFVVGVVLGGVLALVWVLEAPTIRSAPSLSRRVSGNMDGRLRLVVRVALAVITLALPALGLVVVVSVLAEGLSRFGGLSGQIQAAALFLWGVAAVFRLLGLLRRPGRVLVVVPTAAVAIWLLAGAGYVPLVSGERDVDARAWLGALLVWGLVYAAAEGIWNVARDDANVPSESDAPRWCLWLRQAGTSAAAVSASLLVLAFLLAAGDASTPGEIGERDDLGRIAPGVLDQLPSGMGDPELAYAFLPVLELAKDEPWWPTRADAYVTGDVHLQDLSANTILENPTVDELPTDCDDVTQDACHVLACPKTKPGCTADTDVGNPVTAYAHVVRFGRTGDRRFFAGRSSHPFRDSRGQKRLVNVIVQYWFFYRHDRWSAVTPVGYLVQEHAADWESVTIGVSGREPLFVAYSAHCGGRWYPWADVEVQVGRFNGQSWARTRRLTSAARGLHPVVAVALGSHANYLHSWYGRPPDWGSCRRVPEDATFALTYSANVRDVTGDDRTLRPTDVAVVDESDPAMSFRGFWGPSDEITLEAFGDPNPLSDHPGRGPTSPALKDVWNRPIQTIFSGRAWKEGET